MIDRVRFRGEPRPRSPRTRRSPRPPCARSSSTTTSCRCSARSPRRAPTTPRSCTRASCGRALHGLGELPAREGNVCYRYRLDAGSVELPRGGGAHGRGRAQLPAVHQYAMETHTVVADFGDGEITLWASCQHLFLVRAEIADLFNLPIEARVIVPYLGGGFGLEEFANEDGADHRGALLEGRPSGADSEQRRGIDGDHAPPRHALPDADHRRRRRKAALAKRPPVARHRRLRRQRPLRLCHRGRCRPRSLPLGCGSTSTPAASTRTPPAGSYRAFGAAHLQWIGELQVDEIAPPGALDLTEIRRRNLLRPGRAGVPTAAASRSMPTWSVTSRRSRSGDRLGRAEGRLGRARARWSGCWRPARTWLRAPTCASRGRRQGRGQRRDHRDGPGARTVMAQIAAQELADRCRRGDRAGRRHALYPL